MELSRALERIWGVIDAANVYIDRTKPWALAKAEKSSEAGSLDALNTSLYYQTEAIRIIALLLSPFIPNTAAKILSLLGVSGKEPLAEDATWGRLQPGTTVQRGEALFPRRAVKEQSEQQQPTKKGEKKAVEKTGAEKTPPSSEASVAASAEGLIGYDDFRRVSLCVGQIMAAERIVKSEKLLKLQVDVGEPTGTRQIVAGIGKVYTPEELIGRKVVVVKNLKPAKLMGEQSNGMLLAASDESGALELLTAPAALPPGSGIS
jgi:methionyl-tRNA synthetase